MNMHAYEKADGIRPVLLFFDTVSALYAFVWEMDWEKQLVQKECVCRRTKAGREW